MDYIELALMAFEKNNYELCVQCLATAYTQSKEEEQEEILDFLYQNFILPNENEFRVEYEKYAHDFFQIEYEKLFLDFIPVAENRFVIFDKEQKKFEGILDCREGQVQLCKNKKDRFNAYVFADLWDIRLLLPYSQENKEQVCYLITNNMRKSAAFAKVPGFKENFMKNIFMLPDLESFMMLFEQNQDIYIPKQLMASESMEKIEDAIRKLHRSRVEETSCERNNILLSICIPSYNRGNRALKIVENILSSNYDSEIEVIVSNNGSVKQKEGYEAIKQKKDSRVRYFEFDENQMFIGNVEQVLSMARGKFFTLCSDEDTLVFDDFPFYMEFLRTHPEIGILFSGREKNGKMIGDDVSQPRKFLTRYNAGMFAATQTYITGAIYNKELFCGQDCLKKIKNYQELSLVKIYPHLFVNMLLSYNYDIYACSRVLWYEGEVEDLPFVLLDEILPEHMSMESRRKQFRELIKLYIEVMCVQEKEIANFYFGHSERIYNFIMCAIDAYPRYFEKQDLGIKELFEQAYQGILDDMKILEKHVRPEFMQVLKEALDSSYHKQTEEGYRWWSKKSREAVYRRDCDVL